MIQKKKKKKSKENQWKKKNYTVTDKKKKRKRKTLTKIAEKSTSWDKIEKPEKKRRGQSVGKQSIRVQVSRG